MKNFAMFQDTSIHKHTRSLNRQNQEDELVPKFNIILTEVRNQKTTY